jgi:hypothetical protein
MKNRREMTLRFRASSQWTRWWREMDSNFRFLVAKGQIGVGFLEYLLEGAVFAPDPRLCMAPRWPRAAAELAVV